MGDLKLVLETAVYRLLEDAATITWPVFNGRVAGQAGFNYVVMASVGGNDEGYHQKQRGMAYEYQVVAISLDRAAALAMAVAIDAVMAAAKALTVTGGGVVTSQRTEPVDFDQELPDLQHLWHVGGRYEIELEATP